MQQVENIFKQFSNSPITGIDKLPQAGSDRQYYRIKTEGNCYIATVGKNIKENKTFIYFSRVFTKLRLTTPQVYAVSEDQSTYIQQDFGTQSLLDVVDAKGLTDEVFKLYQKSLKQLAALQVKAQKEVDFSRCLTNSEFGKEAILADLLYFKYYFLDTLAKPYDKQKLLNDFNKLSDFLTGSAYQTFMFRDFQGRNIMIGASDEVNFIDYQGGMKGAPQYDAASLLWQARANLPDAWKEKLLTDFIGYFENETGEKVNADLFKKQYYGFVLIRLLQVLGAYGFRGLFERKAHFLTSIPLALKNLNEFLSNHNPGIELSELDKVLQICISNEIIGQFTPFQATDETPLLVTINSFSYKKGIPSDSSENGGGFVFDMRGILNPGRFIEYKTLSGLDKPVKDFLEQQTQMPVFINSVFTLIDISVTDYLKRGFASLMINFGCTGGQHRSVYAAEALARHLKNKFKVKTRLTHLNQQNWLTKN